LRANLAKKIHIRRLSGHFIYQLMLFNAVRSSIRQQAEA